MSYKFSMAEDEEKKQVNTRLCFFCTKKKVKNNSMTIPSSNERTYIQSKSFRVRDEADAMEEVFSRVLRMTEGKGDNSYAKNSSRQNLVFRTLQPIFAQILQEMEIQDVEFSPTLRIADLGCATGMNAISEVDFVLGKIKEMDPISASSSNIQVFFNDLPSNDFGGLFMLLDQNGKNDKYFATAVPRSFYNVLFPPATIHVAFTTMALHWLSKVPKSVRDKKSTAYNRDGTWINNRKTEAANAYAEQSQKDLKRFFSCRGREMASGGVLYVCAMGRPDDYPVHKQVDPSGEYCGADFEAAWKDMIDEGHVRVEARDGFNLPWYFPTAQEMRKAVESTNAFEIRMVEVVKGVRCMHDDDFLEWVKDPQMFGKKKSSLVRSFVGSLVEETIGSQLTDLFFEKLESRSAEFLANRTIQPSPFITCTVAALIKR